MTSLCDSESQSIGFFSSNSYPVIFENTLTYNSVSILVHLQLKMCSERNSSGVSVRLLCIIKSNISRFSICLSRKTFFVPTIKQHHAMCRTLLPAQNNLFFCNTARWHTCSLSIHMQNKPITKAQLRSLVICVHISSSLLRGDYKFANLFMSSQMLLLAISLTTSATITFQFIVNRVNVLQEKMLESMNEERLARSLEME